ncbi:MAG: hypothetical protein JXP73_16965, partial [Deltaproteobacteria bacterium]|nr:hypothetical protein [Deltaproteobacteria bacterium]
MKTKVLFACCAAATVLAAQGLVGCDSSSSGLSTGTGGAKGTGGVSASGGTTTGVGAGGSVLGTGGRISGTGGATRPPRQDGGPTDLRPTQDTNRNRDAIASCGGEGEDCCPTDPECEEGLVCRRGTCVAQAGDGGGGNGDALVCGGEGEDCCPTDPECEEGLVCRRGTCVA